MSNVIGLLFWARLQNTSPLKLIYYCAFLVLQKNMCSRFQNNSVRGGGYFAIAPSSISACINGLFWFTLGLQQKLGRNRSKRKPSIQEELLEKLNAFCVMHV